MTLSKDAKKVLYRLYKEYLDKRNHGFSKSDSVKFGSSEEIRNSLFPELLFDDVDCFLRELRDNDLQVRIVQLCYCDYGSPSL